MSSPAVPFRLVPRALLLLAGVSAAATSSLVACSPEEGAAAKASDAAQTDAPDAGGVGSDAREAGGDAASTPGTANPSDAGIDATPSARTVLRTNARAFAVAPGFLAWVDRTSDVLHVGTDDRPGDDVARATLPCTPRELFVTPANVVAQCQNPSGFAVVPRSGGPVVHIPFSPNVYLTRAAVTDERIFFGTLSGPMYSVSTAGGAFARSEPSNVAPFAVASGAAGADLFFTSDPPGPGDALLHVLAGGTGAPVSLASVPISSALALTSTAVVGVGTTGTSVACRDMKATVWSVPRGGGAKVEIGTITRANADRIVADDGSVFVENECGGAVHEVPLDGRPQRVVVPPDPNASETDVVPVALGLTPSALYVLERSGELSRVAR